MEPTVRIPDELASRMSASGGDLSRRALEALALEELKTGRITKPELRRLRAAFITVSSLGEVIRISH
jgi:hypothetical protein